VDKKKIAMAAAVGAAVGVNTCQGGKYIKKKKEENGQKPVIPHKQGFYEKYIKRPLDIVCSAMALILLSPIMLVTALKVRFDVGTPVLFSQRRIGKNNEEFNLLKFRSMTEDRDDNGIYLPDSERITKFGQIIRTMSIDELPSLFNIIKGDMSIIGPRPLPVRYLDRYTKQQLRRHEVRPGLSCPSIVAGRNDQAWEKQFEGDVWYVDHVSFLVDLKCIIGTVRIVLSHKGATASDGGSRGEFIGTASVDDLMADSEGNYMKIENG